MEAELSERGIDYQPIRWSELSVPNAPLRVFYYGKNALGPGGPQPGEMYIIQRSARGKFFVERLPAQGGPAEQLTRPFDTIAEAQREAARH